MCINIFLCKITFGKCADYLFSNEHINFLITYSFDFRNEELLSYYISFLRFAIFQLILVFRTYPFQLFLASAVDFCLFFFSVTNCICWRAISGKLNKNTISLLVKTEKVNMFVCVYYLLVVNILVITQFVWYIWYEQRPF